MIQGSQSMDDQSWADNNRFPGTRVNNMYASPRAQHYGAFVYVFGSAIGDHMGLHTNNLNFLGSDDVAEGAEKKLFSLIFFQIWNNNNGRLLLLTFCDISLVLRPAIWMEKYHFI